ncbi:MAG: acyl-CoA mutase large subunit family protein [Candidatus Loosdrechtia sp.]|uniref:acyl-CoA mutase large subunit family protein n=1 Tax=Candidatus Loosdrechtia sp. TaxID=3101272 RepID=UPI003A67E512|nr:MAG: methylmalonyl-CoA mutase family protein [Candidatus Jettenia sp. AMX2]
MDKHPALVKWEETVLKNFSERTPERAKEFRTSSGLLTERLALPEVIDDKYLDESNFPGQYPFTRGVYPTMYRGRLWTMRQYAGFATAEDSNKRYRYLLEQGTTGLSVAFDLPTQVGYDSDHRMSRGEAGRSGVAIDTLADMECLFTSIPLDKVSTSMTINAPAAVLLAMYVAVAEKQGINYDQLKGTIQNDILKEYIARGTYIFPPRPSLRLTTDIIEWCSKETPQFNTISISGYHIREAGSTAVQEVAFTLANGCAYVQAVIDAGLDVDTFAPRMAFFFASSSDFLEEIAKFRAARRLWAKLMKERFRARKPQSQMLRFHTQTSGSTLTAQQTDNNIVRVALQALAAVFGGTQSLHTNSCDEALSLPTEDSVRLALRTQQIIAYESGVCNTVDPLGGSYYIEDLTERIEREAVALIGKIDQAGGMVAAIESGMVQHQIADAAYEYQRQIETGERFIVGVNRFQTQEPAPPPAFRIDMSGEENQIKRLIEVRTKRDNLKVKKTLTDLKEAAQGEENLMPFILESVRSYASLGEICDVLRGVFGVYEERRGMV